MTGLLGFRTTSYGSLQQQHHQMPSNGPPQNFILLRKHPRMSLSASRDKERFLPFLFRHLSQRNIAMLIFVLTTFAFCITGFFTINREESSLITSVQHFALNVTSEFLREESGLMDDNAITRDNLTVCGENTGPPALRSSVLTAVTRSVSFPDRPCEHFAFPPPPPGERRRIGPRPCPVCYLPVEQAIASMPRSPSASPLLRHLSYYREENPVKTEPHGGSDFGGYPSLKQRNDTFTIREAMAVHCGFVKGCRPGHHTGFDIDVADLLELEQFHNIIVASAIFGNYDIIQQPKGMSQTAKETVPFFMFIDEETEVYMKNNSVLGNTKRVGLWRIVVVRNIPYTDARRNGKVPKLLLHRLFPNVRYSIWIDGKLQLVVDPYQILERFLWRQNATFAISRHYRRFDVFEEAEANRAAGKYDNTSINYQMEFYKKEGLTPYSASKLPITSDVPEGCVIIKEHIPITNLFTCLWFNEVDRFTSRDQLSFSTVRDKIMAKVNWSINMFLDCERRNFVVQAYHRDLLEQMAPPAGLIRHPPPAVLNGIRAERVRVKRSPIRRGRGEKRPGSRRHRKVVAGNRDNT